MIIASIAMEELALSHILNAEGEKLQYILGTLPGTSPCACPRDVLTVNKSVTALVEAVTQNQMLLKNKLSQVLEFCPLPPAAPPEAPPPCRPEPCPPSHPCTSPHPPQCPPTPPPPPPPPPPPLPPLPPPAHHPRPCEGSTLQLTIPREGTLWNPGCRLTWKRRVRLGKSIRWSECAPAEIYLSPRKRCAVRCTLNVRAATPAKGTGTIFLRQSPCGMFTDALPLRFPMEHLTHGSQSLQLASVLHPCSNCECETCLFLVLDAKSALWVEGAEMNVIELP